MKRILFAVAIVCLLAIGLSAQQPIGQSGPVNDGLTSYKVNSQLVAAEFAQWSLPSTGSPIPTSFSFAQSSCYIPLGVNQYILGTKNSLSGAIPSVKILDANTALNETLTPSAVLINGGTCTLSLSPANTHTSYTIVSGTCGLGEALAYAGTTAIPVIVTNDFYQKGCTKTTIQNASTLAFQPIYDAVNGTWYKAGASVTTNISAAAAPTTGTVAGGTFTNGNVIACVSYVDILGGESLCNTNETTQATGGTTNGITVAAPAASTGAVGYRVYLTAVGGSSGTEVDHTTAANCGGTLTTLETIIPACPMGVNFTALAPITSTSKVPTVATAHTTFLNQPVPGLPPVGDASQGTAQLAAFNFTAQGTVNNSAEDIGELLIPANYFNFQGRSWWACAKIATATQVASSVIAVKINLAAARGQSPVSVTTITFATQTQGAAGTIQGCSLFTTSATGASGTMWASSPFGPWTNTLNSTPSQTVSGSVDVSTAVSSTLNLTKQLFATVNFGETASHNVTAPQLLQVVIFPAL